jgi:hypothetical protein
MARTHNQWLTAHNKQSQERKQQIRARLQQTRRRLPGVLQNILLEYLEYKFPDGMGLTDTQRQQWEMLHMQQVPGDISRVRVIAKWTCVPSMQVDSGWTKGPIIGDQQNQWWGTSNQDQPRWFLARLRNKTMVGGYSRIGWSCVTMDQLPRDKQGRLNGYLSSKHNALEFGMTDPHAYMFIVRGDDPRHSLRLVRVEPSNLHRAIVWRKIQYALTEVSSRWPSLDQMMTFHRTYPGVAAHTKCWANSHDFFPPDDVCSCLGPGDHTVVEMWILSAS